LTSRAVGAPASRRRQNHCQTDHENLCHFNLSNKTHNLVIYSTPLPAIPLDHFQVAGRALATLPKQNRAAVFLPTARSFKG
jgi:hypothetical protein